MQYSNNYCYCHSPGFCMALSLSSQAPRLPAEHNLVPSPGALPGEGAVLAKVSMTVEHLDARADDDLHSSADTAVRTPPRTPPDSPDDDDVRSLHSRIFFLLIAWHRAVVS